MDLRADLGHFLGVGEMAEKKLRTVFQAIFLQKFDFHVRRKRRVSADHIDQQLRPRNIFYIEGKIAHLVISAVKNIECRLSYIVDDGDKLFVGRTGNTVVNRLDLSAERSRYMASGRPAFDLDFFTG